MSEVNEQNNTVENEQPVVENPEAAREAAEQEIVNNFLKAAAPFNDDIQQPSEVKETETTETEQPSEQPKVEDKPKPTFAELAERQRQKEIERRGTQAPTQTETIDWNTIKNDPDAFFALLDKQGISTDTLVDRIMDNGTQEQKDKMDLILERLDQRDKQDQERLNAQKEQEISDTIQEYKDDLKSFISEHKEQYPLVNALDLFDNAYSFSAQHTHSTGELLEHDVLLNAIEEQVKQELTSNKENVSALIKVLSPFINTETNVTNNEPTIENNNLSVQPRVESRPITSDHTNQSVDRKTAMHLPTADERVDAAMQFLESIS